MSNLLAYSVVILFGLCLYLFFALNKVNAEHKHYKRLLQIISWALFSKDKDDIRVALLDEEDVDRVMPIVTGEEQPQVGVQKLVNLVFGSRGGKQVMNKHIEKRLNERKSVQG